ncbi:hypothetical protein [Cupriavidus pauculus]|jgi:hypothetical protein|uniref:hypothetical protein n=1 Tax=Cupriavidus pauculus TaxID=82633 RepID=UPI0030F51148
MFLLQSCPAEQAQQVARADSLLAPLVRVGAPFDVCVWIATSCPVRLKNAMGALDPLWEYGGIHRNAFTIRLIPHRKTTEERAKLDWTLGSLLSPAANRANFDWRWHLTPIIARRA